MSSERSPRAAMWKALFDVSTATALLLAGVNLASKQPPVPWWLVGPIFAFALVAFAIWLHDAAHITFVAHRIDNYRARKAAAEKAVRDGIIANHRAIAKEKDDQESGVYTWIWNTDHYLAHTGNNEWTVALVSKPPRGLDPREHPEWVASCLVLHAGIEYRSEQRTAQYLGVFFSFPQDFMPRLDWPLPSGFYEVGWTFGDGSLSTYESFTITEGTGFLDGKPPPW